MSWLLMMSNIISTDLSSLQVATTADAEQTLISAVVWEEVKKAVSYTIDISVNKDTLVQ